MIFADASALVAILTREIGYADLGCEIADDNDRYYSAMSRWETIAALCRSYNFSVHNAKGDVDDFLEAFKFEIVAIGDVVARIAIDAFDMYGKGRHPAALNMGDCFAYACAKSLGARLLYKGEDFSKTDMAWIAA